MEIKRNLIKKTFILLSLLSLTGCNQNKPILKGASISEDTKFEACNVNISIDDFNALGFKLGDSLNVRFSNGYSLTSVPYYDGYYVKNGDPVVVAYPNSETISITYNNIGIWYEADLSSEYTVDITLYKSAMYLDTQEDLSQSYSLERSEYDSDEEFSNFRALKGGLLKENLLYRGASPFDNSRKRAKTTDSLLEKNNIKYILNLADSEENIKEYLSDSSFSSEYAKNIYEEGNISLLSLSSNFMLQSQREGLVKGFKEMLNGEGPYYIHCTEGKDRTGFVCMLIEALAGSTYLEMKEDYMQTYKNYYKVSKGSSKYSKIVSLYFDSFIGILTQGSNNERYYDEETFKDEAVQYLKDGGMSDEDINSFITLITYDINQ